MKRLLVATFAAVAVACAQESEQVRKTPAESTRPDAGALAAPEMQKPAAVPPASAAAAAQAMAGVQSPAVTPPAIGKTPSGAELL